MNSNECQLHGLARASEGTMKAGPSSLPRRLKLALSRRLTPAAKRKMKVYFIHLVKSFSRSNGQEQRPAILETIPSAHLKAGDWVRVRSKEEIKGMLNMLNELKGCGFMPEMWQFCDTTQRVLKPVNQFLDERDYKVKKCNGIVLLEGAICQGTALFGPCDRSCFLFWREEWLEKIEQA